MMQKTLKKVKRSKFTVPLSLLVICVLAYGLLIPTLGFYWDDFPYAWINHKFGPAGYPEFVSSDRPHSAWIFMALTWLLGEQPIGYHISALLLYWLCALLFWQLIRLIWPRYEKEALWAAMLFAIYPGFLGHPNAIIYNHHFSAMALYLFSLIGTVHAVDAPGKAWRWHIPALLAMSLSQFSIEYYLGWEAVRLFVIWFIHRRRIPDQKKRLRMSLLHAAPYGLVTLGFLFWRVLIFRFPTYQPVDIGETEFAVGTWLISILAQTVEAVIEVWSRAFPILSNQRYSDPFWGAYLALTVLAAGFVCAILYLFTSETDEDQEEVDDPLSYFGVPALIMALTGIAFAGWPFWLTGLNLRIEVPFSSRFTLAFIPWAALLVVSILHLVAKIRFRGMRVFEIVLVAFLVGGSTGWHLWNTNLYRNDWLEVERYFQQMVHRIPRLEPGTTLLVNDMPFLNLYSDNSLTAVLNWTYAPDNASQEIDYMMYYLSVRLGLGLPALEPGLPIEQPYRSLHFSGSSDQILVVYTKPPGCLRVLDAVQTDRIPNSLPEEMVAALPLSNLSLIRTDQSDRATPPAHLFETASTSTWCLYFEEADLAGQQGDWVRVAELGDKAFALKDRANELTEYFVFIEGYLRAGRPETALELSQELRERSDGEFNGQICNLWQGVENESPEVFEGELNIGGVFEMFCLPE